MKKTYMKPLLSVELFSLSQTGGRDCNTSIPESQLTLGDPGTCVWDLGGGNTVFIAGQNCLIDGESMNVGCYNNPGEGSYVFRS